MNKNLIANSTHTVDGFVLSRGRARLALALAPLTPTGCLRRPSPPPGSYRTPPSRSAPVTPARTAGSTRRPRPTPRSTRSPGRSSRREDPPPCTRRRRRRCPPCSPCIADTRARRRTRTYTRSS
eukprot:31083-Pelagococcus_subviridis.AAC.15